MKLLLAVAVIVLAASHLSDAYSVHQSNAEARSAYPGMQHHYPVMHHARRRKSLIERASDAILGLWDRSLGRQSRSAFGEIFGVQGDDAMKVG